MKIFTLSLLFIFTSACAIAQDSLPNPSFELWTQEGGYTDPNDWTCLNPLTNAVGFILCKQDSTIVHTGKYSCNLVTKYIQAAGQNVPGTVSTGSIDATTRQIVGGQAVTSRPLAVTGWYQYAPAGSDTGNVNITLSNNDTVVGTGSFNFYSTGQTWTYFSMHITYSSATVPDTSLLSFLSSGGNGTPNSSLWLDDVAYVYSITGIKETESKSIAVYPNPTAGQFVINNQDMNAKALNLFAVDGKLVKVYNLTEAVNTLDASDLSQGLYIIRAVGNDGFTYTNSLVINR